MADSPKNSPLAPGRSLPRFWPAPLVFLATLCAYGPALHGGLVWDDDYHVTKAALRSLHGLRLIWFQPGATAQYYPVLHSAFWLEHRLWGDATLGYHLVNVLLHATSACLFALVLIEIGRASFEVGRAVPSAPRAAQPRAPQTWAPWFAALLFALHPVCVESVAWISEQKNALSMFFYLLAALGFLRWRRSGGGEGAGRIPLYGLATACFALALLSKSVTATLPAALLVLLWWQQGSLRWRRDVRPLVPWLALGAGVGLFTAWFERHYIGAEGAGYQFSAAQRLLIAGRVVWFYLGKLLWPSDLIFIYPRWTLRPGDWRQWLPVIAAAAASAGLLGLALRRTPSERDGLRQRFPLCVWLFFVGSLFPALGFLNVYPFAFSFVADHFQYIACLGIFAAAAAAWAAWPAPPSLRVGSAAALLAVLGVLTWRQSGTYRDARTLYRTTLARNPECWLADTNLGTLLMDSGHPAEAIGYFETALKLNPDSPEENIDLGDALHALGRSYPAMTHYTWAIHERPSDAQAHYDLAVVLAAVGRLPDAIEEYRTAVRLNPGDALALANLAAALRQAGRLPEAEAAGEAAQRLDPASPEVRNNLGIVLAGLGRGAEAEAELREALRLRPDYAEAGINLGNLLRARGDAEGARLCYERALQADPRSAAAHYNLAVLLASGGRMQDALAHLQAAVRLRPDYPEAEDGLGNVMASLGREDEAVAHYRRALQLAPRSPGIHYNLALALHQLGREAEARRELQRSRELGLPAVTPPPPAPPP